MKLIIEQLPKKAGWSDAHVVPWDLAKAICQSIIFKKPIVFSILP